MRTLSTTTGIIMRASIHLSRYGLILPPVWRLLCQSLLNTNDVQSPPLSVEIDADSVENHRSAAHLEAVVELREVALDHGSWLHADDGVSRADHAHIGDVRGPACEHALIGGRDMRVRPEHDADAAVQVKTQGLFLSGGF